MITVVDDNTGKVEFTCTEAAYLLGAIHLQERIPYDDGSNKALKIALNAKDHVFHFSKQEALNNFPRYSAATLEAARKNLSTYSRTELIDRFVNAHSLPDFDDYNKETPDYQLYMASRNQTAPENYAYACAQVLIENGILPRFVCMGAACLLVRPGDLNADDRQFRLERSVSRLISGLKKTPELKIAAESKVTLPKSGTRLILPFHNSLDEARSSVHPKLGQVSVIQFDALSKSPIHASEAGTVLYSGWYGGYGRSVLVKYSDGISIMYCHLSTSRVFDGEQVDAHQTLGYVGSTGFANGLKLDLLVDASPSDFSNLQNKRRRSGKPN